MDNFDNVLVIDADGHVSEGNIDFASRLPENGARRRLSKLRITWDTRATL